MYVNEFLKSLGYDTMAHTNFISNIMIWRQWYKGKVDNFHTYSVYNGCKDVTLSRLSLQIPKFISEKMADLLFNEKVRINLGNEESSDVLNKILAENNFQLLMNRAIEKSFAMGTGCIVVNVDNIVMDGSHNPLFEQSKITLNYIDAENLYPLSWDDNGIKELAIIRYEKISTGQFRCIITLHVLNEMGNYVIKNYQFITDNNKKIIEQYNGEDFVSEFDTKSSIKWFSIIQPNIINNIDMSSPYGISIFANSIDVIKGIDIIYDSFINEIQLGRKRLFTTKEVLRFNAVTGKNEFNFDPNDIIFYVLGDSFSDGDSSKNYIQEVNGTLRITEHINALNENMRVLGSKMGFGTDYFTFDKITLQPKTATQVISENNELFRTITKHEILLEKTVKHIVDAIGYIGRLTNLFNIDTSNLIIDFDDSIIQSEEQERSEDREDLAQDTLSRVDYVMRWRGLDRESAEEKIREIDGETPAKESIHFVDGEIN